MPEIMASQLRVLDWPFASRLSLFMGLADSPNRCTKVKWATLWGCRQHLLYFGAAILYSKPFIFLTPRGKFLLFPCMLDCRPVTPTEIEDCLQRWGKGQKSKIWLHVDTVLRECPRLGLGAFKGYLSNTEGRSAAERGFDLYVHRRALFYVFILAVPRERVTAGAAGAAGATWAA